MKEKTITLNSKETGFLKELIKAYTEVDPDHFENWAFADLMENYPSTHEGILSKLNSS